MFKGLMLRNFRNFNQASVLFGPRLNVFLGDNGQGKTNLLEAIYVLSTGSSFRFAENENLIQKSFSEAAIKTKIFHGDLDYEIQASIMKSRKNLSLQGKKVTSTELVRKFPVVIFSPESLAAIKDGADQRRQLIDELLISYDPKNAQLIADFRKCLKSRNKVLKELNEGTRSTFALREVLESLNPIFIDLGTQLSTQRILALKALLPDFNNAMQNISNKHNVDISVEYVISGENALLWDVNLVRKSLERRMEELADAEVASGASLVGPQKHDIRFLYDQNDSRFYCSQGQQRALILSFKMAQIVYHRRSHGAYPVLLLDDVLSELDFDKRQALISFLTEIDTQIFITTTDLSLPADLNSQAGLEKCSVIRLTGGVIHDSDYNTSDIRR